MPKEIKRILAIRLAYIGDVVLTIPAIKVLRDTFPNATICFLTSSRAKDVIVNNPYIDEIMTYDAPWFYPQNPFSSFVNYLKFVALMRSKRFDMVIDFRGDFRNLLLVAFLSGANRRVGFGIGGGGYLLTDLVPSMEHRHKVQFHLDLVRALGGNAFSPDSMNLYPSDEDRQTVAQLFQELGIRHGEFLVGLHPGGRVALKCWDMKSYAEVADALTERYGARIIVTGGADEVALGDKLLRLMKRGGTNLCGRASLRQMQVILRRTKLFVTNDTAGLHIASGVNTPTVAIFGPSEVWDTGPLAQNHKVIMRELDCRTSCDTYRCHNDDYHRCLRSIKAPEVVETCVEVLEKGASEALRPKV